VRWLLRRLQIYPNAYYSYRKHQKAGYLARKAMILEKIRQIYHSHNGVDGYRTMQIYLGRAGYQISPLTVHKYMNTELRLMSVTRRKKPDYRYGKAHKIFNNKLNQDFRTDKPNQKWCTDFTYLFLKNGEVRYNCSILDLYDRSIVASITDRSITSDLAIRTLKKALASQPSIKGELILHSDQGSQYTAKAFVQFCESVHVTQSMSKAGYPYDNAPMERYFNTLKNECTNLYQFRTEEELYKAVEKFAYIQYNHIRPHSYNAYKTPYQTRTA
jgi:transposase InsO family protein